MSKKRPNNAYSVRLSCGDWIYKTITILAPNKASVKYNAKEMIAKEQRVDFSEVSITSCEFVERHSS